MKPPKPGLNRRGANVTIVEIAQEAGVSIRTVSRVLNNERHVGRATRERVAEVIERHGFVPSAAARALPGGRSYTLGLVFAPVSANYLHDIQLAAIRVCQRLGYRLVIGQFDADMLADGEAARAAVAALRLDAAVLVAPASDHPTLLDALEQQRVRYSRITPGGDLDRSPAVVMDDAAAMRAMVGHLAGLGHRSIGFVVGNRGHSSADRRLHGFREAMAERHLPIDARWIEQGDYSHQSGLEAGGRILDRADRPTAIFASNDLMAAGVIAAAAERGLTLPRDLSVCGFDDSPVSRLIWPPLTTIRQPLPDMAAAAVEQMLAPEGRQRIETFDHALVCRKSTARPGRD